MIQLLCLLSWTFCSSLVTTLCWRSVNTWAELENIEVWLKIPVLVDRIRDGNVPRSTWNTPAGFVVRKIVENVTTDSSYNHAKSAWYTMFGMNVNRGKSQDFNDRFIVFVFFSPQIKFLNSLWLQPLTYDDLILFFVLYVLNTNIIIFWTVGQTKQNIRGHQDGHLFTVSPAE